MKGLVSTTFWLHWVLLSLVLIFYSLMVIACRLLSLKLAYNLWYEAYLALLQLYVCIHGFFYLSSPDRGFFGLTSEVSFAAQLRSPDLYSLMALQQQLDTSWWWALSFELSKLLWRILRILMSRRQLCYFTVEKGWVQECSIVSVSHFSPSYLGTIFALLVFCVGVCCGFFVCALVPRSFANSCIAS